MNAPLSIISPEQANTTVVEMHVNPVSHSRSGIWASGIFPPAFSPICQQRRFTRQAHMIEIETEIETLGFQLLNRGSVVLLPGWNVLSRYREGDEMIPGRRRHLQRSVRTEVLDILDTLHLCPSQTGNSHPRYDIPISAPARLNHPENQTTTATMMMTIDNDQTWVSLGSEQGSDDALHHPLRDLHVFLHLE